MWENYYSTLKRLPKRLKELAPYIVEAVPDFKRSKTKIILDLGCGAGRHSVYLAHQGFSVIGVDVSRSALKITGKWARKEKLTDVALVRATMTHLPFADCTLDAVVSVSVIHHALKKDVAQTIDETHRILKKNGLFLANVASEKDPRYGKGKQVEDGTFSVLESFENKRFEELHHFLPEKEVCELLSCFDKAEVKLQKEDPYYWEIRAIK